MVLDVWGMLLEHGLRFVQVCHIYNSVKEQDPLVHGQMESPNTSLQAIELYPSCSGQAQSKTPGTGYGYKSMEPGCTLTVLRVPPVIHPLRSVDVKSGKVV